MKLSELIEKAEEIEERHGDLPVVGGYLTDDTPPRRLITINKDSVASAGHDVIGVFIE